jgi:DNA modification methylase
LNLGDSYASDTKWGGSTSGKHVRAFHGNSGIGRSRSTTGLPGKNLIGIPWRVAFALQDAGWYLRQDIIWHKPNPMPESVTDRCTKAHEYLFLMSRSARYFWDNDAMQERAVSDHDAGNGFAGRQGGAGHLPMSGGVGTAEPWTRRSKRDSFKRDNSKRAAVMPGQTMGTHRPDRDESDWATGMRNRRSVWTVPIMPYSGSHFATFPPALIEPCILAGSRTGDVVLDPFFGSGTTGQVAQALGRKWIGCELNPEYALLQEQRTAQTALAL